MNYRLDTTADGVTVSLEGLLNYAANQDFVTLLQELGEIGAGQVVFDLSALRHIDSVGLGMLYIAKEQLAGKGASICLSSPQPNVKRMLELTEAGDVFEIRPVA